MVPAICKLLRTTVWQQEPAVLGGIGWWSAALKLQIGWNRERLSSQRLHSSLLKKFVVMSINTSHCIVAPESASGAMLNLPITAANQCIKRQNC